MRPRPDTPASDHAMESLLSTFHRPEPAQQFNAGVVHKLTVLGLARLESRPSPYDSHRRGTRVNFLICTEAGEAELKRRRFLP